MERVNKNSSIKFISKKGNNDVDEDFSSFQRDVANALLDYIDDKDDAEVVSRLEETKHFFNKLSKEISSALPSNNIASDIKNEDFDCLEDILKGNYLYLQSSLIH